jgi:hypothetical protein
MCKKATVSQHEVLCRHLKRDTEKKKPQNGFSDCWFPGGDSNLVLPGNKMEALQF